MSQKRPLAKNRRKKKKNGFLFLLIIVALLLTITVGSVTLFKVKNITVKGTVRYSEDEVIANSGITLGDKLLLLNQGDIEKEIMKELTYVDSVSIKKKLNGTLIINVTESAEAFSFNVGGVYYLTDSNYRILSYSTAPSGGILVSGAFSLSDDNKYITAEKTDKAILNEIVQSCNSNSVLCDSIDMNNSSSISITAFTRFTVDLGEGNHISRKIAHLKGMIVNIEAEAKGRIALESWTPDNPRGYFVKENEN